MDLQIRPFRPGEEGEIWRLLQLMLRLGETYTLPSDMSESEALTYWLAPNHSVFVAVMDGLIAGTFYLRANQQGGGAHIANCGYVVDPAAQGRGIAKAMCLHSLDLARDRGFRAMQFNFVVSTNVGAVQLWKRLGFKVAGTLPGAFQHPRLGYVDALVMFRSLLEGTAHQPSSLDQLRAVT